VSNELNAIDEQNGNIVAVLREQIRIAFNIYFAQTIKMGT